MAEYFNGEISIGGQLRRKDVPSLCDAIKAAEVNGENDWGGEILMPGSEEDLLDALDGDDHLRLCSNQATYGAFPELEKLCVRLGLYFIRKSDASYEYNAECVYFLPGMLRPDSRTTDVNGHFVAYLDDVEKARQPLASGQTVDSLAALDKICGPELQLLPSFEVIDDGEEDT